MGKFIKEPLFHFILIGAGIFFFYFLLNKDKSGDEIVIDNSVLYEITEKYQMQWNRKPTTEELASLVQVYIDQEVLYREALAMNLDHNDEVIKRRMAQKMEFISDELVATVEPDQSDLLAYYEKNKSIYKKPAVYTLTQIYFSNDLHQSAWDVASHALQQADPRLEGDRISLPKKYDKVGADKLALDFGSSFAAALDTIPVGEWSDPVRSGLGVHLVYIELKELEGFFPFDQVKEKVKNDFNYEEGLKFRSKLIKSLLGKYKIEVQIPESDIRNAILENI